jgi:hypothetical protein
MLTPSGGTSNDILLGKAQVIQIAWAFRCLWFYNVAIAILSV